jgi:hypothetical protein
MAKKQDKPIEQKPTVFCSDCKFFIRDTTGPSFNAETREFFMGVCSKGLHPDSVIKQFANKPRHCSTFKSIKT